MQEQSINERREICNRCPIFEPVKGLCNPKLWLDPNTNDVSISPKSGYIRGCGCHILIKMRNQNNHCIAGKW